MLRIFLMGISIMLLVSACSSSKDTFYKHQPSGLPLEVPPDLTIIEANDTFEIPEISQVTRKKLLLENGAEVVLKKDGQLRWIIVDEAPELVWEEVKNFWLSSNVNLKWESQELGILETDWLKSYDSKFDLDRFRVRIEAVGNKTEIYLIHRGKQQEFTDGEFIEGWVTDFNDPELEIEVLGQMLSYFGLGQDRKDKLLAEAKKAQAIASIDLKSKDPHILINDDFERSWKLTVQAIDRAGHVITQQEKAKSWLDIRLVKEGRTADFVPGFALSEQSREVIRVQLKVEDGNTSIYVLTDDGQIDRSEQARNFLRELNRYL